MRILATLAFAASFASAQWDQSGAALTSTPTNSDNVGAGYEAKASQADGLRLQSGFLAHRLFRITAPYVMADIADRKEFAGFPTLRFPLSDVFADLDGDTLRFGRTLSGSSVGAKIVNDTLVLSNVPGSVGSTTVSVMAYDGSDSASTSFTIDVIPSTAVERRSVPKSTTTVLDARVHGAFAKVANGSSPAFLGRGARLDEDQSLGIDILLPGPALVSVAIYDNMGVPVMSWSEDISARALAGIASESDGRKPIAVTWNLKTPDGRPVPSGVYLWRIVAKAANGEELETVRRLGVRNH